MKIYLDNCCYNRPYDKHQQSRVKVEAAAILSAVAHCEIHGYGIVGSIAIWNEINKITKDIEKLENVRNFYKRVVNDYIPISQSIADRALALKNTGLRSLDVFHLAFAEAANVDFLLTTDNRFVNAGARLNTPVKIINPINFLQEATQWLLRSM